MVAVMISVVSLRAVSVALVLLGIDDQLSCKLLRGLHSRNL